MDSEPGVGSGVWSLGLWGAAEVPVEVELKRADAEPATGSGRLQESLPARNWLRKPYWVGNLEAGERNEDICKSRAN